MYRKSHPVNYRIIITLACLLSSTAMHAQVAREQQITDSICNSFISQGKSPGLAVAVIRNGKVYTQGYGLADKEKGLQANATTIFEIGSITKVFTACIGQRLTEKKEISWSDNILTYLPAEGRPDTDDGTTLLHLVTHTAGYPRVPLMLLAFMQDQCDPYSKLTAQNIYGYLKTAGGKEKPDMQKSNYSNFGMGLLGHILEWKTGKTYNDLLQEHICGPLRMKNTVSNKEPESNYATGYDKEGQKTCHWTFGMLEGAGGIRSNAVDMAKFLQANMSDEGAVGKSLQRTHVQQLAISRGGQAYGWIVDTVAGKKYGIEQIIWHNGGTGGFRSFIGFSKADNIGVVILANQAADAVDGLALQLLGQLAGKADK